MSVYLSYNYNKKSIPKPNNFKELFESFIKEFDEASTETFEFNYKDKNGQTKIITDNFYLSDFKENMEINVIKKKRILQTESSIEIEDKEEEDIDKKIQEIKNETMKFITDNLKLNGANNQLKKEQKNLENDLKKLEDTKRNETKNKEKKNDIEILEQELKELEKSFEESKNSMNQEINELNLVNKNYLNELTDLDGKYKDENDKNNNIQSDLDKLNITLSNKKEIFNDIEIKKNKIKEVKKNIYIENSNTNLNDNKKEKNNKNLLLKFIDKEFKKYKDERQSKLNISIRKIKAEEKNKKSEIIKKSKMKLIQKNNNKENKIYDNINDNDNENNKIKLKKQSENLKLEDSKINNEIEMLKKMKNEIKNDYGKKIEILENDLNKKKEKEKEKEIQKKIEEEKKINEIQYNQQIKEDKKEEKKKKKEKKKNKMHESSFKLLKDDDDDEEEEDEEDEREKIKEKEEEKIEEKDVININLNINNEKGKKLSELNDSKIGLRRRLNSNSFNDTTIYTYECKNILNLNHIIYIGTESAEIPITLKNTGLHKWPPNTLLVFDPNSELKGKNVPLSTLNKDEEQEVIVKIENLGNLKEGIYNGIIHFNVNRKNFGNELKLRLTIKKKEVNPIEKYRDKIYEFRSLFDLREEDHDDEKLFNLLIENDFNNEKAFEQLFS